MFTRSWKTICSEWHFRTPAVRLCTPTTNRSFTVPVACVYRRCTKLGGPVAPYTPGVCASDRSNMFTRPWQTVWSEGHFRTPAVWICTPPSNRSLTVPVDSVYRSSTKLGVPVAPCTPGVRPLHRSSKFTRPWRTICSKLHFRTPAVWICTPPRSRTTYSCNRSEYASCTKLGGPVAPCTPGVRPLDHSSIFTRRWRTICSERHFHTPAVRLCMPPSNRSLTVPVDSVYRTCIKLGGPVAPCTPGV